MSSLYMTSREFNQDTSRAKRAAEAGPVFITDRGRPAHVLMSIEQFDKLGGGRRKDIVELLAMPGGEGIDFEPRRMEGIVRPADLD